MTAILMQSLFAPKPEPAAAGNDAAAPATKLDGDADSESVAMQDGEAAQPSATSDTDGEESGATATEPATEENEQSEPESPPIASVDEFEVIMSPRYRVTVNKRGATIRRVELILKDDKGRYQYRDLESEGGYLGNLECENTDRGCVVRAVPPDTPAAKAGLAVGDIIVAIESTSSESEAIVTRQNLKTYLAEETKPNSEIQLSFKRSGEAKTVSIKLTSTPLAVLRPEPEPVRIDPEFDFPESFVMTLLKPLKELEKAWPDIDARMRDGNWTISNQTEQEIEFKFELTKDVVTAAGLQGPIYVYKTYSLPTLADGELDDNEARLDTRSFHLNMTLRIENGSDQAQKLAFELDGPTGLTTETWWYANKIHGRTTALFYIAGARDVVGSTAYEPYVFLGAPELIKSLQQGKNKFVSNPLKYEKSRLLNWVGVDAQYFNVSLLPVMPEGETFEVNSVTASPNFRPGKQPEIPKNARLQKLVDCTFQMVKAIDLGPGESYSQTFEVFCGPKEPELLEVYGLSDVRTFGWFSWFAILLLEVLHFFYYITFQTSYGLAIVLLTVCVRSLMIPFSRKAAINAQMMQHLAPQIKEISDKYKDDMAKKTAAQQELYKKYKFNPLSGCLMMFFQLPIFYGLYKGLNVDIALRDKALIPGIEWCSDLAAPDKLLYWKDWMPSWLADETGFLGPYLNILPLLTMVLFIAQQKLFTPPPTDDQQKMMQRVMTFMMVFMGVMFFKVPAGLCIYFITSSLWGIIERKLLPKPVLDTDKLAAVDGAPVVSTDSRADKKRLRMAAEAEEKRSAEAEARRLRNAERKKRLKRKDGK